ncbi:energy transducer TonB [Pseudoxanthomonas mexicana]
MSRPRRWDRRAWSRTGICFIVAYLASGCAHRIDRVDQRLLLPDSAGRYEMAAHQAFVYPVPIDTAGPAFPLAGMPRELPAFTLCVAFVVDDKGRTTQVVPLRQAGCVDGDTQPLLRDAALSAVAAWTFEPAMFCDYPDAMSRDRDWNGYGCAGERVQARVVPVTLAYAFTFEIREGRQRVAARRR